MLHTPLTMLLVEDNPCDAELLEILLRSEAHSDTNIERVKRLSGALDLLKVKNFDLILLDLTLPDGQGMTVFLAIQEAAPRTPVVILTGLADARLAVETVRLGAQDYLVKDEVEGRALGRALSHAIERKKVQLEAEEMRQRKTEFVAMVSHELRNPMTGIVGFIHLLSKTDLDDMQREYVMAAQNGARSLLELLNGLLDLSSAEAGHLALDLQPLDLRECLESTATFSAPQAGSKGLEMVSSIDPRIPDLVLADSLRLRQVLGNLLGNAIKFTDKGYVGLFARMRAMTNQEVVVRFVVEDSGRGIPRDKRAQIFQAFSQAQSDDRARGAGLGLSISKELIAAMGGVLGVESQLGEGTAFWFDLNFSVQKPSSLTGRLQGHKVLVRDTHLQTREAMEFALTKMGAVVATQDGHPCDWIITDKYLAQAPDIPQLVCCHQRGRLPSSQARYIARPMRLSHLLTMQSPSLTSPVTAEVSQAGMDRQVEVAKVQSGRILVVDDDPLCRHLVVAVASQCGLSCDAAENGATALKHLAEGSYEMIFLDFHLPDCTGVQLAERIRQCGHLAPLISLSGSDRICHPQFVGCLTKPVHPLALEKLLKRPPAVDWQVLERFKKYRTESNQSLIRDLVESFTSSAPQRTEALQQASRKGSEQEVRRVAHLLRGAAATVGAVAVAAAAGDLESAPDQPLLVEAVRIEVGRSLQVFRDYLQEANSDVQAN